jgi:hypothetical protein
MGTDTLRFTCPHCSAALSAPLEAAGRASRCRGCRQPVTVPALAPMPPPAAGAPQYHYHEQDAPPRRGPSPLAALAWLVVLLASLVVCGGIGYAAWQAAHVPLPEGYAAELRALGVFLIASFVLVPAYIGARALDRLTQ